MQYQKTILVVGKLSVLAALLLTLLALTYSVALAAPPPQDATAGQGAWEQALCKNCHGASGEGLWAGPLAGSEKTAEEFISQVRSPRRFMPHFTAEQVSDQVITDMHAYLSSLTKPASFTPADAGLADTAPEGQKLLVEKRCVACHTTTGPVKAFTSRGETPTAQAVIAQLRTPRQFMPSFSPEQVSDAEATLIAEFLASQVAPATLPTSGGAPSVFLPLALFLVSGGLLLTGIVCRYRLAHR